MDAAKNLIKEFDLLAEKFLPLLYLKHLQRHKKVKSSQEATILVPPPSSFSKSKRLFLDLDTIKILYPSLSNEKVVHRHQILNVIMIIVTLIQVFACLDLRLIGKLSHLHLHVLELSR